MRDTNYTDPQVSSVAIARETLRQIEGDAPGHWDSGGKTWVGEPTCLCHRCNKETDSRLVKGDDFGHALCLACFNEVFPQEPAPGEEHEPQ